MTAMLDEMQIPVFDPEDVTLALAEIEARLLPWLVREVVRVLVEAGVRDRAQIELFAQAMVERLHPAMLTYYRTRCGALQDEMRAERNDDDDDHADDARARAH